MGGQTPYQSPPPQYQQASQPNQYQQPQRTPIQSRNPVDNAVGGLLKGTGFVVGGTFNLIGSIVLVILKLLIAFMFSLPFLFFFGPFGLIATVLLFIFLFRK